MNDVLQEEMSQRASAETMVRMLEAETTEQRHSLAEERGKIAKLEALVVHLEVLGSPFRHFLTEATQHERLIGAVHANREVVFFQSEVNEKTLIANEYKSRLEEVEMQLQEANEKVTDLTSCEIGFRRFFVAEELLFPFSLAMKKFFDS